MINKVKLSLARGSISFNGIPNLFETFRFEDNKKGRNELFNEILNELCSLSMIEWKTKTQDYIIYFKEHDKYNVLISIGKKEVIERHIPSANDFEKEVIPNYRLSKVIVNRIRQVLIVDVIERSPNFNKILTIIENVMQKTIHDNIEKNIFNTTINLRPIMEKNTFWAAIERHKNIKEASFELLTPNAGRGKKKLKELLEEKKKNHNVDKTQFNYKSNTQLNLYKIEWLEDIIDYISDGQGNWVLKKDVGKDRSLQKIEVNNVKNIYINQRDDYTEAINKLKKLDDNNEND